jgi:glycerol uptake facilitator-like aquaporin
LIAELLGTMFLVIVAIASTILPFMLGAPSELTFIVVLMNAIAVTFVLFALIESFGSISGAHFNPVVTLALLLNRDISMKKASLYIMVQFIGGFLGLIVVHLMFWDYNSTLLVISTNVRSTAQVFSEFICTFILVGVIFGCVKGGSKHTGLAVATIVGGMLITSISTMFANPVVTVCRMFTYAICGIAPINGLEFILAEIIGAVVAAYVFGKVLFPIKLKEKCDPFDCPTKPIKIEL